ncbi:MAG: aminotransferase class I/II-fold pyridoxal phosphate-dependent enzyme [Gammaproteobacteria bacterium]|nr:aminotransferase class I/II-fold pyridoxal phosphate-dependent enzyme [Gammaproteobacteria bacterium]
MTNKKYSGLTAQLKDKLIQQALERKLRHAKQGQPNADNRYTKIPEEHFKFHLHPSFQQLLILNEGAKKLGVDNPYFKLHQGIADATTIINDQEYVNFTSYNYLGLNGHPMVNEAAKAAIDHYGTSVSASRPVSGERPIHQELEKAIADIYGVESAVIFVSGHATNVTTIGHLFSNKDLIIHDELIHNSILQGALLSGARRLSFPHNDWAELNNILKEQRHHFERVLIAVEGIYSMDGDYPDLPRFVEIRNKFKALLMVDEAHSLGVMGKTGMGIREHFDLNGGDVDIWMGTFSKALAGCGGYIAGEHALVDHLKFLAPGFLYSVGMSPPLAAASLAALHCMQNEPERVTRLQNRSNLFLQLAQSASINTGTSTGLAIIPAILGSSLKAVRLSSALFNQGINTQPIVYPAVPEKAARLRFFISSQHTESQINSTIEILASELSRL